MLPKRNNGCRVDIVSPEAVNPARRDDTYRSRLFKAVSASYVSLEWSREFFRKMVREYGGPTYGEQTDAKIKYVNKISQFINAYTMILAGNRPQIDVQTNYQQLIPFANHWKVNINAALEKINARDAFRDCAQNSIFLAGFMKVHYADSGTVIFEDDIRADPGMAFLSSFTIEDWVHDQSVKTQGRCRFAGDKSRWTMERLKQMVELGMADEETLEEVRPTSKREHDADRAEAISNGQETDDDEMEPSFDVLDVYDYEDRVIRTYAIDDTRRLVCKGKEITEVEWPGLETGPYHMYRLHTVPDNIMPKSPLADLEAMDRFINNLTRKTARQISSQKENMVYTPAGKDAADALSNARDRQSVKVSDIRDINVIKQGGVDPSVTQTLGNFLDLFDEQAGNLKQILGLGASAETLGQEQIIQQAGTRMGNFLEEQFQQETERVIQNYSKLMWDDMFLEIQASMTVDTSGPMPLKVDSSWRPGDREGEFTQYMFKVVPYSARLRTPAEKVATVTQTLMQIYIPLQQHLMSQGGMIDVFALNEMLAENLNMPEFRNLITFASTPGGQGPSIPDLSTSSPVTSRNYTRRSVPGANAGKTNWQSGSGSTSQSPQTMGTPQ